MKKKYLSAFLPILLIICSCAPKTIVSDVSVKAGPEDGLFSKAEKQFQSGNYDKALELYRDYIALYPGAALAPDALLKTGKIYSIKGDFPEARKSYRRIAKEYPDSSLVYDGSVEILAAYYDEGRPDDVIRQAADIDDKTLSEALFVRKYMIVGDACLAAGASRDAFNAFDKAYVKSKEQDRKGILVKLARAMALLPPGDIRSILAAKKDELLRDYLSYQLGANYAEKEHYEEALKTFSAYLKEFPSGKHTAAARKKIEEINKKTVYDRYAVGCLLPLSGKYKSFGDRALRGIELAFSQISGTGANPSIRIVVKDTGGDPEKTMLAARELADMNVAAIIGPMLAVEPAVVEAQERKIPIVTLTQKEHITLTGDYVFRNFLTPEMQVKTIVSYAVETLGLKTFAVLYPDEKYGKTFLDLFWDEVVQHEGEIVGVESYASDQMDFAGPIKKLAGLYYAVPGDLKETEKQHIDDAMARRNRIGLEESASGDGIPASNELAVPPEAKSPDSKDKDNEPKAIVDFDAVFIPDGPEKVGLILPQLAYYDVKDILLLGTNLWHSPKLIEMARSYAQGAIIPEAFVPEIDSKKVKAFVETFEGVFGEKPGFIDAVSYDTAMMLFAIISRNDVRFQASIRNELTAMKGFPGVTGLTSFDHEGEAVKELTLFKVTGSRFIELPHN